MRLGEGASKSSKKVTAKKKTSSKKKSSIWTKKDTKNVTKGIKEAWSHLKNGAKHVADAVKPAKKKSTKSKSKPKSKSIMETSTAKKNAEKTIAGLPGSKKKVSTPHGNPGKQHASSTSSKKTSSKKTSSKSSSSKSTSKKTTSSGKSTAIKRATGKSTSGTKTTPKTGTKTTGKTPTKPKATTTPSKPATSKESGIIAGYKSASNSYYNNQKALLQSQKTNETTDVNNAFNVNMAAENQNKRSTNDSYDDRVGEINQNAYQQAQMTKLGAYEMGIQNSQQLLGLQAGDNQRTNDARQGAITERDRLLAEINGRISALTQNKLNDINKINSNYNTGLLGARSEADRQYQENVNGFNTGNYNANRDRAWAVEDRNADYAHDKEMENLQYQHSKSLSGGGGGGGGGGRSGAIGRASVKTTTPSGGTSGLKQQANQYNQSKTTTPLGAYNKQFENKRTNQSVVRKVNPYPLGAPPTVANNPNLTAWQKYKMLGV